MKKKMFKQLLSGLLALVMVLTVLPVISARAADADPTWTKVTAEPSDWSGTYLIVYEGTGVAFNAGLDTPDAASNFISVSISDGVITGDYVGNAVTIEPMEGGYAIKTAKDKYIYGTSGKNKLNTGASQALNTISLNEDSSVQIVSNTSVLRYNANSGSYWFRYFKSDTYTGQKAVCLYRLDEAEELTVAAPTASLISGNYKAGREVSFSCETEGATVYYRSGEDAYAEYTAPITLTEDVTFAVKAAVGEVESEEVLFSYTVFAADATPVTDTSALQAGDKYVIANAGGTKLAGALSSTYLTAVEATDFPNTVPEAAAVFTLGGDAENGWTLTSAEGQLFTSEAKKVNYSGSGVGTWTITVAEDATTIASTDSAKGSLQYNTSAPRFTTYATPQGAVTVCKVNEETPAPVVEEPIAKPTASPAPGELPKGTEVSFACETEGAVIRYKAGEADYAEYTGPIEVNEDTVFTVKAVKDGRESEEATFAYTVYETVTAEYVSGLNNGDKVVIFNPGNNAAVGIETYYYNNTKYELVAVPATLNGTTLEARDSAAVLTVAANENGTWSFVTEDGKYLFCDGTNVNWADEAGEYTEFNAETAEGGWIMKSAADVAKPYIEYYRGYFTSYSAGTGAAYVVNFYATETAPVTSVAAPTASVTPGEVDAGTEVAFRCSTPGATVYYKTSDEGEYVEYTAPIAITEDVTFTVKAVVGELESDKVTFAYTVKLVVITAEYTEEIGDGDKVVIYYPTDSKVVADEVYTYVKNTTVKDELKTLDVTVNDNVLTVPEGASVLTVSVDDDGHYSFINEAGKYLSMDGTNVNWADEPGDYTVFDLEAAEGGSFIKSVNAQYNGKAQYLEYYSNYLTCYSMNASKANLYTFRFFAVEKASFFRDGAMYVIYNPANMQALSTTYAGNYNAGTPVTLNGGVLAGYGAADIWRLGVNADGTYSFSTLDGKKLSMDTGYTSMPLDKVNDKWQISEAGTPGTYYIRNVGRNAYIEWYDSRSTWSCYYSIAAGSEGLFEQAFYPVTSVPQTEDGTLNEGDVVVVYNAVGGAVFGMPDADSQGTSLTAVPAEIVDEIAHPGNGALVFTVGIVDGDYTFCAGGKYLCSNDAENVFLSDEYTDYCKWYTTEKGSGVILYNRTAKYNGTGAVCVEYYNSSFSGWTFKASDADIFIMHFYPVAEGTNVFDGVVDAPSVTINGNDEAYVGTAYTFKIELDSLFGGEDTVAVTAAIGEETLTLTADENGVYTVPVEKITAAITSFTVTVSGTDEKGVAITGTKTVEVKDEPVIVTVTPAPNAQTGDDLRPVISVEVSNAGENATAEMTVNDAAVELTQVGSVFSYTPAEDMELGRTTVAFTVTRADGKTASRTWNFTVGTAQYQLYFGQLHSHTAEYSDGAGTLQAALNYAAAISDADNVDFVAFTDHSNYFDGSKLNTTANPEDALYDMSLASEASRNQWNTYTSAIRGFNETQSSVLVIPGFEMTWSGGPGHINTFNTTGIVSRNNTTLNNKTNDAGMKAYYALLSRAEGVDTISQFNHPGSTFGTFSDFSYWDAVIDSRIYLVEVGNGEGAIGESGYYPSYEEYIKALDKGWHLAPSNNQDNHKGKWGNANTARDVILTDDFSEQGLYAAIRQYRVYSTEDKNLELHYTVNGEQLGHSFTEVPEELNFAVSFYDPDRSDSVSKIEVVANSGKTVYTWNDPAELASGEVTATLAPDYTYYFIRVTQGDGDLAVTAPVWVGESLMLGINTFTCANTTAVTGEPVTLTTSLFNAMATEATVKSLTYTTNGAVVIGTDMTEKTIAVSGTLDVNFAFTPTEAKVITVTVTAVIEQDGKEYTFSKDLVLDVQDSSKLVYVGVDGAHYNEYVTGYYHDQITNFTDLAAGYTVRVNVLRTSAELIAACENEKYIAMIFTAPSRRLEAAQSALLTYTDAELDAIDAFNRRGGTVIVAGWSDYYETYVASAMTAEQHMAAAQNALLAKLGASLKVGDDATHDDTENGGQTQRLYLSSYNPESFLLEGVDFDAAHPNDNYYTELYSDYGGASVYVDGETLPATVTPVVFGHATTYTKDSDSDGFGATAKKYAYAEGDDRVLVLATEQLEGRGTVIVSGSAFMTDYEVQATIEGSAQKNYSNYKICENLLNTLNPIEITPIADVRVITEAGYKFTIEGTVTSNASGYDADTAFFDCIYVQDATGGICCFPVAGSYKLGDVVRITGTTDAYQGEAELQVTEIQLISSGEPLEPTETTAAAINSGAVTGDLVKVTGTVQEILFAEGLVQTIMVKDTAGDLVRVFIDGYITKNSEVANLTVGNGITVIGLASYDNTFNSPDGPYPRIRVRNRAEVVIEEGHTHSFADHICSCGMTDVTMKSHSCSFNNSLNVNYYFSYADVASFDEVWVTFEVEGKDTVTAEKFDLVSVSGGYNLRCSYTGIAAAEIGKEITAVIHVTKEGAEYVSEPDVYSVSKYAHNMMAKTSDDAMYQLCAAVLNYGAAAQTYFGVDADSLVNADLAEAERAVPELTLREVDTAIETEAAKVKVTGKSAVLGNVVDLKFYVTAEAGTDINNVVVNVSYRSVLGELINFSVKGSTFVPEADGTYSFKVAGIAAANFSSRVNVAIVESGVRTATYAYSIETYCSKVISGTDNPAFAELCKAMMAYSAAALAYFGR